MNVQHGTVTKRGRRRRMLKLAHVQLAQIAAKSSVTNNSHSTQSNPHPISTRNIFTIVFSPSNGESTSLPLSLFSSCATNGASEQHYHLATAFSSPSLASLSMVLSPGCTWSVCDSTVFHSLVQIKSFFPSADKDCSDVRWASVLRCARCTHTSRANQRYLCQWIRFIISRTMMIRFFLFISDSEQTFI